MIVLEIADFTYELEGRTYHGWCSGSRRSGGRFFDGRLKSIQATGAHVDQWLPMSSRLSRMAPRVRDPDGEITTILKETSVAGRVATLSWLSADGTLTAIGKGVVRRWKGDPGMVTLSVEDPILRRFAASIEPVLSDIKPSIDEDLAGNLVPQVYGRATRLPVAGGVVQSGRIELVACVEHREVTDVRYDGVLIDRSTWEADCPEERGFVYTRISVSGDNDRDVTKFEWSGGSYLSGTVDQPVPTVGNMIRGALLANGVSASEINEQSFLRFDGLLNNRGLILATRPEGAIVVRGSDETLSSVISRAQNSWGALTYVNRESQFEIAFPAYPQESGNQPGIVDLDESEIQFSSWAVDTPEGATEWLVQSDYFWARNSFTRKQVAESEANRAALSLGSDDPGVRGRTIQLWYARGRSVDNFVADRVLLDRWNQVRGSLAVAPYTAVEIGDFVNVPSSSRIQIPSETMLVDGITFEGDGLRLMKRLTLTPVLGIGETPITEA